MEKLQTKYLRCIARRDHIATLVAVDDHAQLLISVSEPTTQLHGALHVAQCRNIQLSDEQNAVGHIHCGERALAHMVLQIHYRVGEVRTQVPEDVRGDLGINVLCNLVTVTRWQYDDDVGHERHHRVKEFGVNVVHLAHKIADRVGRIEVQQDAKVSPSHNEVGERNA